jgi:GNAT superfamily N-acetyltransferase
VIKIRETIDRKLIQRLDARCFDGEDMGAYTLEQSTWFVAAVDGRSAAYAGVKLARIDPTIGYLSRAGVLPRFRGRGLQRRLIDQRVEWARRRGASRCVTYTHPENIQSVNNLIACGFRLYLPDDRWVGAEYLYWIVRT